MFISLKSDLTPSYTFQDSDYDNEVVPRFSNVTDIETSEYYGDPSVRPARDSPGYGPPQPAPVPLPDQNCYVETPCTR